jgi:hypothetical protein
MIDAEQLEQLERHMSRNDRMIGTALILLIAIDIIAFGAAGWVFGGWILGKH